MTKPLTIADGPTSALHSVRALTETDIAIRAAIVVLALATGFIHATLGGPLFTLNAAGYLVAAIAMVIPLGIAVRYRWLIRLGLIGYAATAIVGWLLIGPRYDVAYLAKAIEVTLIALLAIEFVRYDGNPLLVLRRALADLRRAAPKGGH
jgi:hypothetical protein